MDERERRVGESPGDLSLQSRSDDVVGSEDVPATTGGLDEAEAASRLSALEQVMDLMRPAVQADGGDLVLVDADVATGVVHVELSGACGSCAISAATLQGGVERILRDRLSWVTEVVGSVDEPEDMWASAAMGRGGYVPRLPD
jgi:Fe-S cluster biogenesis protein NfuA